MVLALAPAAAIAFVILYFGGKILGIAAATLIGALLTALILATEGSVGLVVLGKIFERFDISAESTN
jgi:hypothetical protein